MKRDDLQEQLHNEEAEKLKQESESRFNNLNEEKEKIESEKIKLAEEKGKLSNEVELLQKKNKELEEKLSLQQRFITANSKSIPAVPQGAANPVSAVTDFIKPKKFKKWRTSENAVEDAPQQQPEKSPEEIEFEKKKREIDEKLNLIQLMQQHNFHAGRIKAVNDAMAAGVPMPTLAKLVAAEYEEQDFIDFLEVLKIKK